MEKMADELKLVLKDLGFHKPPPEAKDAYCTSCNDQKSYDVFVLKDGKTRIGVRAMQKEFGINYHAFYETVYRERCRNCFGKWEKSYRDIVEQIKTAKEKKDEFAVSELRMKLKQMQEMF